MNAISINHILVHFVLFAALLRVSYSANMVKRFESKSQKEHDRPDFIISGRSHADHIHEVIFAITLKNLDQLEQAFYDVSNPESQNYGNFWSRQQIADLTTNVEAVEAVSSYLSRQKISYTVAMFGNYITAKAKISVFEHVFDTTFYYHDHIEKEHKDSFVRAREYSIDESISHHIETVYNVVDLPFPVSLPRAVKMSEKIRKATEDDPSLQSFDTSVYAGNTYPQMLIDYYNIKNTKTNSKGTQCVYGALKQYFSQNDLEQFQGVFGLPFHAVDIVKNGNMNDSMCVASVDSCTEANLDVQYILAVAPKTPTWFWYDTDKGDFAVWLKLVSNTATPPNVISISYGIEEIYIDKGTMDNFNAVALTLGLQGVTLVVASGDDGAAGYSARKGNNCKYSPTFPASSPYVTSVGATMGPERSQPEIVCSSATGSEITSGGGFSRLASASLAPYQKSAVAGFVQQQKKAYSAITYTPGRGYPDLALLGNSYLIQVGKEAYGVSGTSASAPVFAGMVSLVNAGRLAAGKSALGFLNTALYKNNASIFRDVTSGSNYHTANSKVSCTQGFLATPGWDPVTGFGSVDFVNFCNVMGGGDVCSAAAAGFTNLFFAGGLTCALLLLSLVW